MKIFGVSILVALLVAFVLLGPFITIWSLNTLFGIDIGYSFWTWLAMVWLNGVTFGSVVLSKRG